MTATLGIDPGKKGAIACLTADGSILWVEDMPDATGSALGAALAYVLRGEGITSAVVERVNYMPGQQGGWTFAEGYGAVLGTLGALGIPVVHVTPFSWKRAMKVTKDKESSRQRAREIWPAEAGRFARKRDDGRAEAALIGLYGLRHLAVAGMQGAEP